jgi:hypothetical protein
MRALPADFMPTSGDQLVHHYQLIKKIPPDPWPE